MTVLTKPAPVTAPAELWRYFTTAFANTEYGGFTSAIDYDGERTITADQTVETAALAVLAAAETGFAGAEAAGWLEPFTDRQHGGYLEFLEVSGAPHELSGVKTAHRQLLVALALLAAAEHGAPGVARGREQLRWAEDTFVTGDGRLLGAVARDGGMVLDDRSPSAGVALRALAAVRLAGLTHDPVDRVQAATLVRRLRGNQVAADGSVAAWRGLDDRPTPTAKVEVLGQCLTALALLAGAELLADNGLARQAVTVLEYTDEHLWDNRFSGYWDHCDLDGRITVHREFITLLNSAIPIKTVAGNAWVLLAAIRAMALVSTSDLARLERIAARARRYLESLVDGVHGGVFTGEGYFWTPPGTPTGPFVRQVLPPRDTPGVFHFGSTHYLRLYNKLAHAQVLAAHALAVSAPQDAEPVGGPPPVVLTAAPELTVEPLDRPASTDLRDWLDLDRHLRYIHRSFTPGQGYGWTPRVAPLGSGANHAPSAFGTHHCVANLRALGGAPEEPAQVAEWLRHTQARSGAFADYPGGPADVLNTYLVVNALQLIGEGGPVRPDACVDFLRQCQNDDGGFGVVPGFLSDLFHTNLAVVALHSLGAAPRDPDGCARYLIAAANPDGGYGERVGTPSDTYSVYRAVGTLAVLGRELPDPRGAIQFVQRCQGPGGGFRNDLSSRETLIATYHAVAALFLLGVRPGRPDDCRRWLASCQTPDGSFSIVPGVSSGTIDEGFAAVQSLAILAGALSPYFAIAVS